MEGFWQRSLIACTGMCWNACRHAQVGTCEGRAPSCFLLRHISCNHHVSCICFLRHCVSCTIVFERLPAESDFSCLHEPTSSSKSYWDGVGGKDLTYGEHITNILAALSSTIKQQHIHVHVVPQYFQQFIPFFLCCLVGTHVVKPVLLHFRAMASVCSAISSSTITVV